MYGQDISRAMFRITNNVHLVNYENLEKKMWTLKSIRDLIISREEKFYEKIFTCFAIHYLTDPHPNFISKDIYYRNRITVYKHRNILYKFYCQQCVVVLQTLYITN